MKEIVQKYKLGLILVLGFLIRLFFVPQPGFSADIAYWKWWGMDAFKKGVVHTVNYTGYNYPSFYLYILALTDGIYSLFSPLDTDFFWNENNLLFLFLIKLPYILADIGAGYLIYKIIKKEVSEKWALVCSCFYIFNPVVIFNSSFWGQTDNLAAFLVLAVFYLLFKEKFFWAVILATISFFSKTQVAIFLPFILGFILVKKGVRKVLEALLVIGITVYLINLPYILASSMNRVLDLILNAASFFPYASLNAYNFWWFSVPDMNFRSSSDLQLLFNSVTFKTTGILAFLIWWILALWVFLKGVWEDKKSSFGNWWSFWAGLAIVPFAFYMLPTEMHERYIFPFFLFLALCLPYAGRVVFFNIKNLKFSKYLFYFSAFLITISVFLNLHIVLVTNYPRNGFNILSGPFFTSLGFTRFLAVINIFLFGYFSFLVFSFLPRKKVLFVLGGGLGVFLLLVIGGKLKYYKKEVYLGEIKPVLATSGYGKVSINKTVADRLPSTNYYFFNKAIGTHANSQIVYNINKKFRVFESEIGVDTEANEPATVKFKVVGDGRIIYESKVMRKWDRPKHIEVDIGNVNQLILVVEDGGDGINNDHAGWYNAKLLK